ncbi:MAG TPA: hypothetical protein VHZ55_30910 [Bryobacteraceae bacterium]|nr:hypothetical protein [Bryobacteraceae bacterium]
MARIKVIDQANEVRVELEGRFSGAIVTEVQEYWNSALDGLSPRLFIIDITRLSGYDAAGFKLLRELCIHGTRIAARTARSLAFLSEISATEQGGPALVYQASGERPAKPSDEVKAVPQKRAAAAGA